MYSMMIVDDEPLMLKYLGTNITRLAPDWQVTGEASDGLQAVDLLQRQSFDLVLTDIRMPEMDGLELAKFISEIYPKTKVVIISGFDEFDYARRALRCGVSDYLLKPLNDKSIIEILNKVKSSIQKEHLEIFSEKIMNKVNEISDEKLRSVFLSYSINNNTDIKSLYSIMACKNNELLEQKYFCILILGVDFAELLKLGNCFQEINSYKIRINQECSKLYQNNRYRAVSYCGNDNTAILICGKDKNEIIKDIKSTYLEVQHIIDKKYNIKLICSCGYISEDILCLQKSYKSAFKAYIISFIEENIPVYSTSLISYNQFLNRISNLSSLIYSDFISNNKSRLLTHLTSFFESIPNNKENSLVPIRFGIYLIYNIAQKSKINEQLLEKAVRNLKVLFNNLSLNMNDKVKIIYKSILALNEDNPIKNDETNNQLVDKAKEYIHLHYNEPISLSLVAEKLGVTSSYLSDLFHKEAGEPYSKFVTRVRMEQALALLKVNPNKKIYDLALQVGYVNAKHFNSVFKKFYKMTPTEYLQRN